MKIGKPKDEDQLTCWFEYETPNSKFEVQIKYVPERETRRHLKHSKKKSWKRHQLIEGIDDDVMRFRLLNAAFMGLRGAKKSDIRYMIEPDVPVELNQGEKWDDELLFTPELKEEIIHNINLEFNNFLIDAAKDTESYVAVQKTQELENLESGSGTKKVQKS